MAVSKATLSFISADVGARLVKDIDKTTINTGLLKECEGILAKLSKHKGKKI